MRCLQPVRTVAPAVTPVSLAEAKAHLNVDFADDDALITALIDAATEYFDGWSGTLGRALITQTWQQAMSAFPASVRLWLPLAPVQSITSVQYYDAADVLQTFAASNYRLQADGAGPYIELVSGASWPNVGVRDDAVIVTFVAGYGNTGADVPEPIRQAILLLIGHLYENREAVTVGVSAADLPLGVSHLVAPFARARIY
ncbi:MAG: hypothetical protein D6773_00370 [Alphaproteobacteria bacterium]|nr:MAG: hypothetical protein D6773_00370 [Alphaproteobacteria bacterium]